MSASIENIETLFGRLRIARLKIGLSQQDAATKFSVPYSTYKRYEAGANDPNKEVLESLVRLGINANWLLTGKGEMLLSGVGTSSESKNNENNNVDKKSYLREIGICLSACSNYYKSEFDKIDSEIQMKYADDLHEKMQIYFSAFNLWPLGFERLGTEGVCNELHNLAKLGKVMKFPHNPSDDIFRI